MKNSVLQTGLKCLMVFVAVFLTTTVFAQGMELEQSSGRGPKYLWAILIALQVVSLAVVGVLKFMKRKQEPQGQEA